MSLEDNIMMNKKGYVQGDMKADVKDYQEPMKNFSQTDANKTTEYVSRQDAFVGKESSKIKGQSYKGRYS